jgi:4-aminobutyrate aminotransferase/(S)-3-amino-2-methylpropionate transaminase
MNPSLSSVDLSPPPARDQKPILRTPIPGPQSRALRTLEDQHLAPGAQAYALEAGIVIDHAEGVAVSDVDGNTLLDFVGGIGVGALGHSHPKWVEAIQWQAARASIGSFTSEARVDLLERLAARPPAPGVHRTQLYSGGAEAVESAMRLARNYTGRDEFISFWGAFHGKTMGALSLMGSDWKRGMGPLVPGVHQSPYADCYRCPLGTTYPNCGLACVELLKRQFKNTGGVAAVIAEPVQGTAGNIAPPNDFLPAVAQVARDNDALFIADEMITGFGRTGTFWGVEQSGVQPDIVTLGKAFGGGFPVSGLMTTDAICSAKPWSSPSGSSSSYGGNPLASAAASAAVRIIQEEHLTENARDVGAILLDALRDLPERYPFVGLVDGRGLMIRIELVRDQTSKEPMSRTTCKRLFHALVRRGMLTMATSPHLRLQPALSMDADTARTGAALLHEAMDEALQQGWWSAP